VELNKQEIEHIADLARLDLSEEELKTYGEQLSHVLSYIEQLQAVDTEGVEPTAQVTGLENVFREDEIKAWEGDEVSAALKQAPGLEDNQIKVKRIL
jgi:aspartyl-tRNA(Asn)/glutamyl-tRNA(Gln) amidotransferase subunit C